VAIENKNAPNTRGLNENVLESSSIRIGEKQKMTDAKKAISKLFLELLNRRREEENRKRLNKVSIIAPKKGSILSTQFFFRKDSIQ
jgi:hypothetical protein